MTKYRVMQYDGFSGESYLVQEYFTINEALTRLNEIYHSYPNGITAADWFLKKVVVNE